MQGEGVQSVVLRNSSGESAPAYGLAEISGGASSEGEPVIVIRKPTGTGQIVAVGPVAIPDGREGVGYLGTPFIRYSGSAPSTGDVLRAKSGQWDAEASGGGASVAVIGDTRTISSVNVVRVVLSNGQPGPAGSSATVTEGVVKAGTAATFDANRYGLTPGTVELRPWIRPALFNAGASYSADESITLNPPEFDAGTDYADNSLVQESGNLYQADGPVSAGTFDANDWDLVGSVSGTLYATGSVSAGAFEHEDWTASTATRVVDTVSAPIELEHSFEGTPVVGSAASWLGDKVVVMTCTAFTGYTEPA